ISLHGRRLRVLPEVEHLGPAVPQAGEVARRLLQLSEGFDLVCHILAVDEDVLGVYRFSPHEVSDTGEASRGNGEISLYWGVIGLIARALGVSVESLTVLVLAHELGHAYSHLGFDID